MNERNLPVYQSRSIVNLRNASSNKKYNSKGKYLLIYTHLRSLGNRVLLILHHINEAIFMLRIFFKKYSN